MAALTPIPYHRRNLQKAQEIEAGITLVSVVFSYALQIGSFVKTHINDIPHIHNLPVKKETVPFKITKELLELDSLIDLSVTQTKQRFPDLKLATVSKVRQFFREYFGSKMPAEDQAFCLLHNEVTIADFQIKPSHFMERYLQHEESFKKIELPQEQRDISCFDYVICLLHLVDKLQNYCLQLNSSFNQGQDFVNFLKLSGYQSANLPLQKGDVLVYFLKKQPSHAALVAENTDEVFAKTGNGLPYAYTHKIDKTPINYGSVYLILRKTHLAK